MFRTCKRAYVSIFSPHQGQGLMRLSLLFSLLSKMSSISSEPYQALWYNRKSVAEDPWISLTDHSLAVDEGNIIYGEADFNHASHTSILRLHNGANVYIRKKSICFIR